MSRKTRLFLVILAVLAVVGYQAWQRVRPAPKGADADASTPVMAQAKARRLGQLAFSPCSLPSPVGGGALEAQCTRFEVIENPARPHGRKIKLNIAWLPAGEEADLKDDPVFFLAGGPGQSAVESYPQLDSAFAEVRKHHHVLLVDQRGTGKSNPLTCPMDPNDSEELDATVRSTVACRDRLAQRADLRMYTTTDAVRDLDTVRRAIGANVINLVGVSYGTRVAQQYAMRHPQHTRSIVLDSVAPNSLVLGNIFARNLDDALALQFGRCNTDPACRGKLGDPRRELDTLLATLKRERPLVRYRDATTGQYRQDTLDPSQVTAMVRMYAYQPTAAALLPMLIHEANQGRYEGLMALSQMMFGDLQDMMAMGMQFSVICSEDGERIASTAEDRGTVLGDTLTSYLVAQCKVWPRATPPADFRKPLATSVPALVLEGEYDPVTPPRYGREVVKSLPNGRLLVLRGQGHNVIGAGCMPKLFGQFIDTANAKALNARCLDTLAYAPPFTSYNGWNP